MDAHFQLRLPVLGLQGQVLGYAEDASFDLDSGRLTHIVLRTDWQPIEIRWEEVEFDGARVALLFKPRRRRGET